MTSVFVAFEISDLNESFPVFKILGVFLKESDAEKCISGPKRQYMFELFESCVKHKRTYVVRNEGGSLWLTDVKERELGQLKRHKSNGWMQMLAVLRAEAESFIKLLTAYKAIPAERRNISCIADGLFDRWNAMLEEPPIQFRVVEQIIQLKFDPKTQTDPLRIL